eukprot:7661-Heterococcus_DN1.PRE.1
MLVVRSCSTLVFLSQMRCHKGQRSNWTLSTAPGISRQRDAAEKLAWCTAVQVMGLCPTKPLSTETSTATAVQIVCNSAPRQETIAARANAAVLHC